MIAENSWVSIGELAPIVVARCAIGALVAGHCESPIEAMFGAAILFLHPELQLVAGNDPRDQSRPCSPT
jgi:hypothetical protein